MDVWRVLMKQRLTVVAVTLLSRCRGGLARVSHAAGLSKPSSRIEIKPNSGG